MVKSSNLNTDEKALNIFLCICNKLGMLSVTVTKLTCGDLLLLGNSFIIPGFILVSSIQVGYKLVIQLSDTFLRRPMLAKLCHP